MTNLIKTLIDCEKIEAVCKQCNKGVYRQTGQVDQEVNPIVFRHACNECKDEVDFSIGYPVLTYKNKKFMLADSIRFLSGPPKPDIK